MDQRIKKALETWHSNNIEVDTASEESKAFQGIVFFQREEDGSYTFLGVSQLSEEDYKNAIDKLSQEEYKRLHENEWEFEGLSEFVTTGHEIDQTFQSLVEEKGWSKEVEGTKLLEGDEEVMEDWREQMQKRIALQREESIKNKGRWY